MEEQTRLQASRSGYKGHMTRLFNKIDELVSDDYTTTSLSNAIEQLTKKLEKITKIDVRIRIIEGCN